MSTSIRNALRAGVQLRCVLPTSVFFSALERPAFSGRKEKKKKKKKKKKVTLAHYRHWL
jgi:hypothetical protein